VRNHVAAVALALVAASTGMAQGRSRPLEQTSDFWRELRAPGQRRARTLIEHARRLVRKALRETEGPRPQPHVRAAYLEGAIERLRLARRYAPDNPEVLFHLGRILAMYERPAREGPPVRMDREAIATFAALRTLDPDFEAESVAFELGILHTRVGEFDRAAEEYERALLASLDSSAASVTHANLAEVRMMAGDLEAAVRHYERAIHLAEHSPFGDPARSLALAYFGRAVALDRLGEHDGALKSAQRALSIYGGSMDVLRSPGVFFDPPAEIHYYEALGHMALARAADPSEQPRHLRRARTSWRQYLALSRDPDPWRRLAERHLAEVQAALQP